VDPTCHSQTWVPLISSSSFSTHFLFPSSNSHERDKFQPPGRAPWRAESRATSWREAARQSADAGEELLGEGAVRREPPRRRAPLREGRRGCAPWRGGQHRRRRAPRRVAARASSLTSQPPAEAPAPPPPPTTPTELLLLKQCCPNSGGLAARWIRAAQIWPTPAAAPPQVLLLAAVVDFAPQLPIWSTRATTAIVVDFAVNLALLRPPGLLPPLRGRRTSAWEWIWR
jgi:hypothetical protein